MTDGSSDAPCVVNDPAMLILNAGLVMAPDGCFYADRSWAKDLLRHAAHFPDCVFVAPVRHAVPGTLDAPIDTGRLAVLPFDSNGGLKSFTRGLIGVLPKIVRAMRRVRIVHTCVAGKPFPIGWVAIPLARLMGKTVVVTVESSFWRIPAGEHAGIGRRFYAWFWETANRWAMRGVDYAAYQHEDYRRTLPAPRAADGGVLYQASWIDEAQVLGEATVATRHRVRIETGAAMRFLFAARMVPEKGTTILVRALDILEREGADVRIDIMGEGPDHEMMVREAVATAWRRAHVAIRPPVPYGPAFLNALRDYDAVLVPNLADEQPRIGYDAGSQGVTAIVSDTAGLLSTVEDGVSAIVVPKADPQALARAILDASRERLAELGEGARRRAAATTHERMHADRCRDIRALLRAQDARRRP